jgi:hypothetical protein
MNRISWTILIGIILAFVITLPLTVNLISAQAKIIYFPVNENNTRLIVNLDNLTQTLVNATTNETISVEKLTIYRPNATTNETLTTDTNATTNETLTTDTGNATTNINLTAKFNALQGK